MEETIGKLELKAELSTCEQLLVPHLIKKISHWDVEFKLHHQTILDLVDEEQHETLEQEYAIYNEYDNKVAMITLRLQQLQDISESKSSSASDTAQSQHIMRRLRYLEAEISDQRASQRLISWSGIGYLPPVSAERVNRQPWVGTV